MEGPIDKTRRDILTGLLLPAFGLSLAAGSASAQASGNSNRLVAYLTRSGNTRVVAEALSRRYGADLFEIRPATPYPADYEAHVRLARQQRDAEASPPLAQRVADMAQYDTVFLGFPIWGGALPAPVRTFLTAHDLSGKTIAPFITHGGYGTGSAPETLASLMTETKILDPFVQECDAERDTLELVDGWLDAVGSEL